LCDFVAVFSIKFQMMIAITVGMMRQGILDQNGRVM